MNGEFPTLRESELSEGRIAEVQAGEQKVLLLKSGGRVYAVEAMCPHYGLPLKDGLVCDKQLRCPWHQSVFDVSTGEALQPPALSGLKPYPVRIVDGVIHVRVDTPADKRRFIIIGGGAAGIAAAQTLREEEFAGEITLISADAHAPYDRPGLSKDYLAGKLDAGLLALREASFYQDRHIDLRLGTRVTSVDPVARNVLLSDGTTLPYDALLIATGGAPIVPDIPGKSLSGVHVLRSLEEADRLIADARSHPRVAIVGGSFIAMEAAAALRQRGCEIDIILRGEQPMQRVLGDRIGAMLGEDHAKQGVKLHRQSEVTEIAGSDRAEAVVLADGTRIPCDVVLLAVGVRPATQFLQPALKDFLAEDGGIHVDANLCVRDGVYAAGDIAIVPLPHLDEPVRIEHWRYAEQLGQLAAHNMLGQNREYDEVPYFWTMQYETALDYVGHVKEWDEILFDGDPSAQDFLACYIENGRIAAVCAANHSKQICAVMELMRRNVMPTPDDVRGGGFDFIAAIGETHDGARH